MSQFSILKKGVREKQSTRLVNLIATQIQMSQFSMNWKSLRELTNFFVVNLSTTEHCPRRTKM